MKILLATDGSKYSKTATEEIAGRTFPANSELRIISVVESSPDYMYSPFIGGMEGYYQEADSIAQKAAKEVVETAAELVREKNSSLLISTAVIKGPPKQVIIEDADSFVADLIVVGSHGRRGLEKFLLGSVSQSVALHANCSVEIVRTRRLKPEDQ
ncbi:universal stress protein [Pontibacter sp. E15-1]|uniref:universal stress protein n=1 Tax=Pontibacter sp. E15-1 TaxID=2919918 RepID=UPI001F4F594C|nr:universal stress protein [Pontibacter sp. E15-1]MCJ8164214.1 universal stress protein [Pontibacter sp. E15-1]